MRKTVALLSAFALAFTLTSCGSDDNAGGNSSNSGNSGNSDNTGLVAANIAELNQSVGEKTEDNAVHMTLTGDMAGQDISGEGDMRFGTDFAMTMDVTTPDGDITMLLVDKVIYIKMPAGQEVSPGKPWLKVDSEGSDPMSKLMKTLFDQMAKNADPKASLELFSQAGEITETEENVDVNGENTTHYTITVDVAKLAEAQTDPTLKQAMDQMVQSGSMKDFPVEMWVNDDGLPARFLLNMPTQDPTSGEAVNAEMQVDYTDWGKEVTVEAPPAAETIDAAEAMNAPSGG